MNLEYSEWNSGFQVEEQREVSDGCASRCVSEEKAQEGKPGTACSCLVKELPLKLSKIAGTMNIVTKCVHF